MVNQNPQPEIYTTRHSFANGATSGTSDTQTVQTYQSHDEEVRIYAIMCNMLNAGNSSTLTTEHFFEATITSGPNAVPSNSFDIGAIHNSGCKILHLSSPILVTYRQPLQVNVQWTGIGTSDNLSVSGGIDVQVTLVGERYIRE
tara:strand:+ start:198 stop:629 length:432 start_codon:yes stop_codon:yes gene_type:complete